MTSLDLSACQFEIDLHTRRDVRPELPDDGGYGRWDATLVAYDTSPDSAIEVGTAFAVLFRDARWNSNFYDRMDEVDSDMEIIAAAISDKNGAASESVFDALDVPGGDVVVIDRAWVPEEFRGHQLSHLLVDATAQALSPEGVLVLLPMPSGEQEPENILGLQRHWARAGFTEHRNGVYVRAAVPIV